MLAVKTALDGAQVTKQNLIHPCDVEHSPQLAENPLDVCGFHLQDGQLSPEGQTSISERKDPRSASTPTSQKEGYRHSGWLPLLVHPVFAPQAAK